MTVQASGEVLDRRVKRTRAAIVAAFNRLILERGYGTLTPSDVAAAADVGRSTFYEHFRGLDDLLSTTLAVILGPLARAGFDEGSGEAERSLEHIWRNRRLARTLFNGETRAVVLRSLVAQFEALLSAPISSTSHGPLLQPELIALHLAAGQLALVGAWIDGRSGHTAREIATALRVSGRASILALTGRA